jgi:hypothetical protein
VTEVAEVSSYLSGGGRPTARVELDDEEYLIIHRKGEEERWSIDVSFRDRTIEIYRDEPWQVTQKGGC